MTETVIDKAGRKIQLRKIGVLEQLRLFKALGPQLSLNDMYMSLAITAASAEAIDGVPLPFPGSEMMLEGVLERLGDDGVAAIEAAAVAETPDEVVAQAGNC